MKALPQQVQLFQPDQNCYNKASRLRYLSHQLKQNLQRQLHVTRFAQAYARRAAAIARVGQQPEASGRKVRYRIRPVDQVEDIEDFKAELRPGALRDLRGFEQRRIHRLETRPVQRISRQRAEFAVGDGCARGAARDVEVYPAYFYSPV